MAVFILILVLENLIGTVSEKALKSIFIRYLHNFVRQMRAAGRK
jgi:hypothetical protein